MEKALDKALDMLGAAAAKLGQTAAQMFPEVVRYLMVQQIGITVAALLMLTILVPISLSLLSKGWKGLEAHPHDDSAFVPFFVSGAVVAITGFVALCVFVTSLPDTLAAIASPQGFAVMQLIGKAK